MKRRKRNGAGEEYRREKIARVIQLAFESVGMNDAGAEVTRMSADIEDKLLARGEELVPVESIQDLVEAELMLAGHYEAAKSFILYRNERSRARAAREQLLALCRRLLQTINRSASNTKIRVCMNSYF